MKCYVAMVAVIFFANCGIYLLADAFQDTTAYYITITSSGSDAIVNAIKQYSDITQADENRWGFSWVPGVGSTIRDGMVNKVREFLRVCRGSVMAKNWSEHKDWINDADRANLKNLLTSYKEIQICRALDNLDEQGERARALLGKFANDAEKKMYTDELDKFIQNIWANKNRWGANCSGIEQSIKQQEETTVAKQLQAQRGQLEVNKLWWKTNQLRWQMAKDMSTQAYKGVKWLAQTVNENSAPLLSAAAMWFVYDKMFGIRRPSLVEYLLPKK